MNKNVKNEDYWSKKFDAQMATDDIDVPEDFYDEEILFDDPKQLMDIFEEL